MAVVFEYTVKNPQTKKEIIELILTSKHLKSHKDSSGGEIYRRARAGRFGWNVHVLRPPDAQLAQGAVMHGKMSVIFSERLFLRFKGVVYLAWIESYGNSRKGTITSKLVSIQHKVRRDDGATLKQIVEKEVAKIDHGRVRDHYVGQKFDANFAVKIKHGDGDPINIDVGRAEVIRAPNTSGGNVGQGLLSDDYAKLSDLADDGDGTDGALAEYQRV